jgi:hypothetical protein
MWKVYSGRGKVESECKKFSALPSWRGLRDENNYAFGSQRNNFAAIKVAPMP